MTEEKRKSNTAEVVERVFSSEGLGKFGEGVGMGLAFCALFLMVPLMMFATQWDGRLYEEKECFEFKEVEEKLLKLNTCTGEITEIEAKDLGNGGSNVSN